MPIVKKSISLPQSTVQVVENFVSREPDTRELSTKINEIIEDFSRELQRAKKEIYPLFVESEWKYLYDAFNGTKVTTKLHPVTLLKAQVEDADIYDGLGAKWKVEVSVLLEKLSNLTSFQGYTVLKFIDEWWNEQDKSDNI